MSLFLQTIRYWVQMLSSYNSCLLYTSGRPNVKTDAAVRLRSELLSDGEEHEASECESKLSEANISGSTAKKAKAILGVVSTKRRFGWFWSLPKCDDELS